MTVTLKGSATGATLSGHDALYTYPINMETNGTRPDKTSADTGLPRITLANNATQRVKWLWNIPVDWDALVVRFAHINESALSGNVRFRFAYKLIYLGEGNVDGPVTTITFGARAAGSQLDWIYETSIAELQEIATPSGLFADKPSMLATLTRLGSDGTDTLEGDVSIGIATATRVDVA